MGVSCSIEILLSSQITIEVAELLDAGDGRCLSGDALLQVTVGNHHVDEVVERGGAGSGVGVKQATLAARCHRHANGRGDAGAERPRGDLHAGRVPVFGVTGRLRAFGAKCLEVVEAHGIAGREELQVQRQRRVPTRKHKPVPTQPVRVRGVVLDDVLKEQIRGGCERHRGARVAVTHLLHGIGGKDTQGVYGAAVKVGPGEAHRMLPMAGSGLPPKPSGVRRLCRAAAGTSRRHFCVRENAETAASTAECSA